MRSGNQQSEPSGTETSGSQNNPQSSSSSNSAQRRGVLYPQQRSRNKQSDYERNETQEYHGSRSNRSHQQKEHGSRQNAQSQASSSSSSSRTEPNPPIIVVGVIGRSSAGKSEFINGLLGKKLFHDKITPKTKLESQPNEAEQIDPQLKIESQFDAEHNIMVLNLLSYHDFDYLRTSSISEKAMELPQTEFHQWLQQQELHYERTLLYLFHVCHHVIVYHEGTTFDLQYLKILRFLQHLKHILSNSVSAIIDHNSYYHTPSVNYPGRCIPVLNFAFQLGANHAKSANAQDLKQISRSLDDQIRFLLRKSRLLENTSGTALFALENSAIAHVIPHSSHDSMSFLLASQMDSPLDSLLREYLGSEVPATEQENFFKSFRDYLGQMLKPSHSRDGKKLPSYKTWTTISVTLQGLFFGASGRPSGRKSEVDIHERMKAHMDPDHKFSTSRCIHALPIARTQYLANLPALYNTSFHEKQLQKALAVFFANARGPACEHYANRLKEECTKAWKSGRQLCDAISLTGRPCVYEVHEVPEGNETGENKMKHSSGFKATHACRCGRTRAVREDPFDLQSAEEFFAQFVPNCCGQLENLQSILVPHGSFGENAQKGPLCTLFKLGNSAYIHDTGFLQDGFIYGKNQLLPFTLVFGKDDPKRSGDAALSSKRNAKSKRGNGRSNSKSDISCEIQGHVGFEFECHLGHRFFLGVEENLNPSSKSSGSKIGIQRYLPLLLNCSVCGKNNSSQFQRIFISIPNISHSVSLSVKFYQSVDRTVFEFGSESANSIPQDSFLCLCLPYIYISKQDKKPISSNAISVLINIG